jgi:hypothetical protein
MISSNKKEIKHSARHHDKRKDMHAYMNKNELVFCKSDKSYFDLNIFNHNEN